MGSSKGVSFNPSRDIPDLSGKVILVTGGNSGLGEESILQLAKHKPAKIFMGARSEAKANEAINKIRKIIQDANIIFLEMDLASFASVKKATQQVLATTDRLDILMNNAGIMATPAAVTTDGYEIQFGTNHMGHALLNKLLLPLLEKTAAEPNSDVRIVTLSSAAHTMAPKEGVVFSEVTSPMESTSSWTRYGQSKLANIYFTTQMAKLYPKIKSVSVHPGVVSTNLAASGPSQTYKLLRPLFYFLNRYLFTSVEKGALNQLWAATGKREDIKQGGFYYPVGVEYKARLLVTDTEFAGQLWEFTERELQDHGY
jgi:NAD(P)-dependent dehydrogenase (short-subunit alcohol dehydrogenase family)